MTISSTSIRHRRANAGPVQWLARGLIATAVLALGLAASGAAYEIIAARSDAETYPAPGRLVDVGGYRLHINCVGAGSPVVILDAGLGGSSVDWSRVQPELATTTRVCAYDRAGMGWSDRGLRAQSPEQIAEELHTLLMNADVRGPYVLVAHSLSGKYARLFALDYRQETSGLVLVDARSEYVDDRTTPLEYRAFVEAVESQGRQYAVARRFGIARLFGAQLAGTSAIPAETRRLMALLATRQKAIDATEGEAQARAANDPELRTEPAMGALPLIVLVSDQSIANLPHWAEAQRRQAGRSSVGRMVIASGSSHAIHWDRPDLVIASVREVVARARSRKP